VLEVISPMRVIRVDLILESFFDFDVKSNSKSSPDASAKR